MEGRKEARIAGRTGAATESGVGEGRRVPQPPAYWKAPASKVTGGDAVSGDAGPHPWHGLSCSWRCRACTGWKIWTPFQGFPVGGFESQGVALGWNRSGRWPSRIWQRRPPDPSNVGIQRQAADLPESDRWLSQIRPLDSRTRLLGSRTRLLCSRTRLLCSRTVGFPGSGCWPPFTFCRVLAFTQRHRGCPSRLTKRKFREVGFLVDEGSGRGDRIRTCDLLVPNQALYQAKLHPVHARPKDRERGVTMPCRSRTASKSLRRMRPRGLCGAPGGRAACWNLMASRYRWPVYPITAS